MNKQEFNEAFSCVKASDDLIRETLTLHKSPKTNMWKIVRRVAACAAVLAVLLTALLWPTEPEPGEQLAVPTVGTTQMPTVPPLAVPGILKLYASDHAEATEEELRKYELTDTINSYKTMIAPYSEIYGGPIPFIFRFPEDYFPNDDISFHISVEYGDFFFKKNDEFSGLYKERQINNGDKLYWINGSVKQAIELHGSEWRFYADVIIYAGDEIVGYGIIDFVFYNPDVEGAIPSFVVEGFTTHCFPKVDGEYQNVTEEYVREQIEEYKKMKAQLKGV